MNVEKDITVSTTLLHIGRTVILVISLYVTKVAEKEIIVILLLLLTVSCNN